MKSDNASRSSVLCGQAGRAGGAAGAFDFRSYVHAGPNSETGGDPCYSAKHESLSLRVNSAPPLELAARANAARTHAAPLMRMAAAQS